MLNILSVIFLHTMSYANQPYGCNLSLLGDDLSLPFVGLDIINFPLIFYTTLL